MKKLKVLNLYAGIGGNRKFWEDVEVTAVEMNESIASVYQEFYPEDTVIVGDIFTLTLYGVHHLAQVTPELTLMANSHQDFQK